MKNAILGCILGTAVGDAMGLPGESITKRRISRLYQKLDKHHFLFGNGMISDDTEHTCMTAQALIASAGDELSFALSLARQLRIWVMLIPSSVGLATLRACLKLELGINFDRSGVFSAGNGPATRSSLIGVCYGDDPEKMRKLVKKSTRITHTDPKAEYGALAIALAAHYSANSNKDLFTPDSYFDSLTVLLGNEGEELIFIIKKTIESVKSGQATEQFAEDLGYGRGVSGYIYSTVPIVLHAWLRNKNDYRSAIIEIIKCGGDTDTTAAILGGIVGASVGKSGIPKEWISGLLEWPQSIIWMEKLADRLNEVITRDKPQKQLQLFIPAVLIRNVFFLIIVLLHGFRRLLPPY